MPALQPNDKPIRVVWITTADLRPDIPFPTGGQIYEMQLRKTLERHFALVYVHLRKSDGTRLADLLTKYRLHKACERLPNGADIILMDTTVASLANLRSSASKLMLVHHMGLHYKSLAAKLYHGWYLDRKLYGQLSMLDRIVTVSDYWKNHFTSRGHASVAVVYNFYDQEVLSISQAEVAAFKQKYDLYRKPIIYLGVCRKEKGVREAYERLRDIDAWLVTTGRRQGDVPTLHFELPFRDYLCLLKASSVAVLMSTFEEGWSRVAQEAMLLQTPVVGSGSGGMRELLSGGSQLICHNLGSLSSIVQQLIRDRVRAQEVGARGFAFAKKFDLARFEAGWIRLVHEVVGR